MRSFGAPPSADEIEAIARRTLNALPKPFSESVGDVVLSVEEFADRGTLQSLGIEDAFALSGFFLDRHAFAPRGLALPDARSRFVAAVLVHGGQPRYPVAP